VCEWNVQKEDWHSTDARDVLRNLATGIGGLTTDEARNRLQKYGPNELAAEKRVSRLELLIEQFKNVLIMILIAASVFSAAIGEVVDAVVILAIVVASAGLGFVQEYRAGKALEALKRMLSPTITVLRDGREAEIPSKELVPGDVVALEAGDRIPADARLFETSSLHIDEAALTGESVPVAKSLDPLPLETFVADRKNMVFSGTVVTYGKGKAAVTSTGMNTEFGKIAKEVSATVHEKTPLEVRTESIGKWLGLLSLAVCLVVIVLGVLREYLSHGSLAISFLLEMVMFGIALAVAAVPEALPAIVTGTLAIGMHEMAKRNALVRRMPAVETLGSTTVICSDKTGTLTKGEMTVRQIRVDGQTVEITGVGYDPKGELLFPVGRPDTKGASFTLLMKACVLCNDARLEKRENTWHILGDPTEGAMVVAAEKAGFHQDELRSMYPRAHEVPFSSERKRMSTVHEMPSKKERLALMKGAPEVVLERCSYVNQQGVGETLTEARRQSILKANEKMAGQALRVLGVAYKSIPNSVADLNEASLESNLTFLGLVGMIDPPREEATRAVEVSKHVGMKPIMITGDHKLTAVAIAKEMGIFDDDDLALTGAELERMSDEQLEQLVNKTTVYARVSPEHKLRIVRAWKKHGEVVAMTGDGVNDAPAVKHADIGIAMGTTGTEVTKEASAMVLADDNFATIVGAIEQGRQIYDNIKKYLTYLLQCNLVEILVIGGGVLAGLPLPLLPAQILWVNLVTDGAPALALGVSPPDPDIMKRPPRNPKESLFSKEVKTMLAAVPLVLSPILMLAFINDLPLGVEEARTTLFLVFVFFELVVALNCRSLIHSVFKARPHKFLFLGVLSSALPTIALLLAPQMHDAFGVIMPTVGDIALAATLSVCPLALIEAIKLQLRRRNPSIA